MNRRWIASAVCLGALLFLVAGGAARSDETATPQTMYGFLSGDSKDGLVLSYLEESEESGTTLRVARKNGAKFGDGRTVPGATDLVVNWADFPSVLRSPDGTWWLQWLEKIEGPGFAYGVRISRSTDHGASWSQPLIPHSDRSAAEHGFVSMVPHGKGIALVWLDGREAGGEGHGHGGSTGLYFNTVTGEGAMGEEQRLDGRVCDCCQTDLATDGNRMIAVYRDRSETEIRDISLLRREGSGWSEPATVYADGWEFKGCPVNGPAVAVAGESVAVAWFTAAGGEARVLLAFSEDGGKKFEPPIQVSEGKTLGRVDVQFLSAEEAVVGWMDVVEKEAHVRMRAIRPDGTRGPVVEVGRTGVGRSSGFPRMLRTDDGIAITWTATEGGRQVRYREFPRVVFGETNP